MNDNHTTEKSKTVLLLIDVINDLEFDGGEDLLAYALPMADAIAELKRRAKAAGIPCVYVNDNFGRWQSDFKKLVHYCLQEDVRGRPIVEKLQPEDDDYFVLKPKHSGFYQTALDALLERFGAENLILTGMAGNICVLFTANDAYMRDYKVYVPEDCIASETKTANEEALRLMRKVLGAETKEVKELELNEL